MGRIRFDGSRRRYPGAVAARRYGAATARTVHAQGRAGSPYAVRVSTYRPRAGGREKPAMLLTACLLCVLCAGGAVLWSAGPFLGHIPVLAGGHTPANRAAQEVPALLQNPELPTGCEAVALTDVLLYHGFDVDKMEVASEWLPKSTTDFVFSFLGDPRDPSGHACMAPAITAAANGYLAARGSEKAAADLTGIPFSELLAYVDAGSPVIAWVTIDLAPAQEPYLRQWANGREYGLVANSHCVVLCGYSAEENTIQVSDPLKGLVTYDRGLLARRFGEMGSQAVVVA